METFQIQLVLDTLVRNDSGAVNGHIWLTIGSVDFPCVAWDDFPVIILSWWTDQILSLIRSGNSDRFNFMDGPYWFVLESATDRTVKIGLYKYSKLSEECLLKMFVDFNVVIGAVLSAAETIIDACRKRDWTSKDLETLIANHSQLDARFG